MALKEEKVVVRCYRVDYEVDVDEVEPKTGLPAKGRWTGTIHTRSTANIRSKIAGDIGCLPKKMSNIGFKMEEVTIEVPLGEFMEFAAGGKGDAAPKEPKEGKK